MDAWRRIYGRAEQGWNGKARSGLGPAHDQVGESNGAGVSQRTRPWLVEDHGPDSRVGNDAIGGPAARRSNGCSSASRMARDANSGWIDAVCQHVVAVITGGKNIVDHEGQ